MGKKGAYGFFLAFAVLLLMTAAGCGGGQETGGNQSEGEQGHQAGGQEKIVMKLGTVLPDNEPINEYAQKLADKVAERTNGRVEIQVYPNSTLGTNKDTYEQALSGAPVIGHGDPGYWQDYVPDFGVLNGPYLVDSPDDYKKILASDWYKEVSAKLEEKGLKLLAHNWYFGERHVISHKEIRTPEDLKGMKMRIPPNVMWRETVAAMGANPTELQWSEVYTGLSGGVIDAAEAPFSTLYGSKLHETAKIISKTGHFKALSGFVIGTDYFNSLPQDVQTVLLEEFEKFGEEESIVAVEKDQEWQKLLEEEGVQIVEDVDVEAFREATQIVYTKFDTWTPGLYERIREIVE